mmetsp:Transcript_103437/g.179516  ORF Transcript_103437/g.179516 Transcript_103437/m.179516 type:complete len:453 (-) Transcript_103437:47-1405(-)
MGKKGRGIDRGDQEKALLQAFQRFDINGDGFISFDELRAVFHEIDKATWTMPKLKRLMREADTNEDDKIDYEEFISYICTGTKANWCKAAIMEAAKQREKLKLSLEDAESMLRGCRPSDWTRLANTEDVMEQLVMRVGLVYVGHENPSWENAQSTLGDPFEFLKAMMGMEAGALLTVDRVRCADSLGRIHLDRLKPGKTAWVLAQYLTACLNAARERLGIVEGEGTHLPGKTGYKAPKWPIKIELKDLARSLKEAARCRKTPLVICNGMESTVDTFCKYRGFLRIDAKRLLIETSFLRNSRKIEESREDLRKVLVAAMKAGAPLVIRMGNTAIELRDKFCEDGSFPKSLFRPRVWNDPNKSPADREYMKILTPAELEESISWEGGPATLGEHFFVMVTSDFSKESAIEFLPPTLPYLDEMAIIEIDPPTGGSFEWGGDEAERAAKFGSFDDE